MKRISLALLTLIVIPLLSACGSTSTGDTIPHSLGNPEASVLIEEFSDVQCPACGAISPQVEELVRKNSDIVQMKYYHFPLSQHEYAFIGAEATECAGDQDKFWEYLGILFENQRNLSEDFFYTVASNLKLNEEAFRTCLDNNEKKAKVMAHAREGRLRSIPGTPTLFVNGTMVKWSGAETFEAYIKSLAQ